MGELRFFQTEDWYLINDPVETGAVNAEGLRLAERGVAITYEENNRPMGCGGIILYTETEGEVWLRLSRSVLSAKAARTIKEAFQLLREVFPDVKLWCRVQCNLLKAKRLIQWLGFTFDSTRNGNEVYTWL